MGRFRAAGGPKKIWKQIKSFWGNSLFVQPPCKCLHCVCFDPFVLYLVVQQYSGVRKGVLCKRLLCGRAHQKKSREGMTLSQRPGRSSLSAGAVGEHEDQSTPITGHQTSAFSRSAQTFVSPRCVAQRRGQRCLVLRHHRALGAEGAICGFRGPSFFRRSSSFFWRSHGGQSLSRHFFDGRVRFLTEC